MSKAIKPLNSLERDTLHDLFFSVVARAQGLSGRKTARTYADFFIEEALNAVMKGHMQEAVTLMERRANFSFLVFGNKHPLTKACSRGLVQLKLCLMP